LAEEKVLRKGGRVISEETGSREFLRRAAVLAGDIACLLR
jgi:hypothetical protein